MQVLADECAAEGALRVNSLNPGSTRTAMRRQAYPAENPADVPPPEARLDIYIHLLSDAAKGVTGQALDARTWRGTALKGTSGQRRIPNSRWYDFRNSTFSQSKEELEMVDFHDPRAEVGVEREPYGLAVDLKRMNDPCVAFLANGFPDSERFLEKIADAMARLMPQLNVRMFNKGRCILARPGGDARMKSATAATRRSPPTATEAVAPPAPCVTALQSPGWASQRWPW